MFFSQGHTFGLMGVPTALAVSAFRAPVVHLDQVLQAVLRQLEGGQVRVVFLCMEGVVDLIRVNVDTSWLT